MVNVGPTYSPKLWAAMVAAFMTLYKDMGDLKLEIIYCCVYTSIYFIGFRNVALLLALYPAPQAIWTNYQKRSLPEKKFYGHTLSGKGR